MDEYRNQNSDEHNDPNQVPSSDFPYDHNQDNQQQQQIPMSGQPYWQGNSRSDQQNGQPYWQNGQQNWQNGPQNGQQYWQNNPQNGQQYWQSNPQNGQQQYWQNNPQNGMPYGQPPKQRNNLALASMIFGILALLACCIPFIQFPLAVVAIVLVILSKKKRPFSGFAIAGLVMGIIAIIISILMTLYWGAFLSMMNDPEFMEMYNELLNMYQ